MKRIALLIALIIAVVAANAQDGKRCAGITTKNIQCKNVIKEGTLCHVHNGSLKCGAKTSKNQACKMKVAKEHDRCRFHPGQEKMKL
jgi:hypothetical protein